MTTSALDAAIEYHGRGFCVLPIKRGTKRPAVTSWKRYQQERPCERDIRCWFAREEHSIAIVCGVVSNGLTVRDFDDMERYQRWAATYPELATRLPTVRTTRGMHVYFRSVVSRIKKYADGELRGQGYVLAPPSVHPGGANYVWEVPPGTEILRLGQSEILGMSSATERDREDRDNREYREHREHTEPHEYSLLQLAEEAIQRTMPSGHRQRHRLLFDLARELKAIPEISIATFPALKLIVREWHRRTLPYIATKPFEDSWFEFCDAWERVNYPSGQEPIRAMFDEAAKGPVPPAAQQYEGRNLQKLVAFCEKLQEMAEPEPFFLSCRMVASLLEVDVSTANRWLRGLCRDGVLTLVEKGSQETGKASRYMYQDSSA